MKLAFAAVAALTLGAASPKADLTVVKTDLRKLLTAQETYYTKNNSYSSSLAALTLSPSEGVSLKLLEFTPNGYSAEGTLKGADGVSCVYYVGRVSLPKTAKGKVAEAEGGVMCDE